MQQSGNSGPLESLPETHSLALEALNATVPAAAETPKSSKKSFKRGDGEPACRIPLFPAVNGQYNAYFMQLHPPTPSKFSWKATFLEGFPLLTLCFVSTVWATSVHSGLDSTSTTESTALFVLADRTSDSGRDQRGGASHSHSSDSTRSEKNYEGGGGDRVQSIALQYLHISSKNDCGIL